MREIALPFAALGIVIVLGVWMLLTLVRRLPIGRRLSETNDIVGFYITIIGTLYAVVVAFILASIWQQFDAMDQLVNREANAAADISRLALGFPAPLKGRLRGATRQYVLTVLNQEWPSLERGDNRIDNPPLEHLWHLLTNADVQTPREQALYSETLTRLTDMAECRRTRLREAKQTLPDILWWLLVIGGIITVGFSSLFGVERLGLHVFKASVLALIVYATLFCIWELDLPFQRGVTVKPYPFECTLQMLNQGSDDE